MAKRLNVNTCFLSPRRYCN